MPNGERGGQRALAGFLYQLLATATFRVRPIGQASGTGDVEGAFVLLTPEADFVPEPRLGEDLRITLDNGRSALLQFKRIDLIDLSALREIVQGFVRTWRGLVRGERENLSGLWLVTTGRLARRWVTAAFEVARLLREGLKWDEAIPNVPRPPDHDGTWTPAALVKRLAAPRGQEPTREALQEVQRVLPLLQIVEGLTCERCTERLMSEARRHGVLDEELQAGIDGVLGRVLRRTQEPWLRLTRDEVVAALAGRVGGTPPGPASPSALHGVLAEGWEEWARGLDRQYDRLVERPDEVASVVQRLAQPDTGGWVPITGEGGVGKTGVLLLAGRDLCRGVLLGEAWPLLVGIDFQTPFDANQVWRELALACGRQDDSPSILERIRVAARAADESFVLVLLLDGADEGTDREHGLSRFLGFLRGAGPKVVGVCTCRRRAWDNDFLWARGGNRAATDPNWPADDAASVALLTPEATADMLVSLGLTRVGDAVRERWLTPGPQTEQPATGSVRRGVAASWPDHVDVLRRMLFLSGLREMPPDVLDAFAAAIGRRDPDPANAGLRWLASYVVQYVCTKAHARGLTVIEARQVLRRLAANGADEVVPSSPGEADMCYQAEECGLLTHTGDERWRWQAAFLAQYVREMSVRWTQR